MEALVQAQRSEELRNQLGDLYEAGRAAVGRILERAVREAELADEHARACASFLIAVCDGLLVQWFVDPERAPTGEELIAGLKAVLPVAFAR